MAILHGLSGTPEYRAWIDIKTRCYKPSNKHYQEYGGRGIKMCDRWLESVINFVEDMGRRPSSRHSIDRIDNDGDYSPENCRWTVQSVQLLNRRVMKKNKLNQVGIYLLYKTRYHVKLSRNGKQHSFGTFSTLEEAMSVRDKAKIELWSDL